jgi:6-phosphogluconolactonase (cycloisomerase 2 family)
LKRLKKLIDSKTLFTGSYSDAEQHHDINIIRYDEDGLHYRYGIFDNENPSYLAWEEPNLYVLHELDEEVKLSTYSYFKGPISIFKSNEASIKGAGACHMYTTPDMAYIFVSCYGSGHLHVYSKKDKAFINTFTPDDNHNEVARAHGSIITNSGKWLLTVDLGRDYIRVFNMDKITEVPLVEHSKFSLPQGSGPRQVILSKEDRYIYCMNELNNSIMILSFDNATGEITELMDTIQASEQDVNAVGTSILTKDHSILIVPNRGPNSLSLFKVKDEKCTKIDEIDCMGDWPRLIAFSKNEKEVFVANQKSGQLAVFNLQRTGKSILKYIDSIPIPLISYVEEIIE